MGCGGSSPAEVADATTDTGAQGSATALDSTNSESGELSCDGSEADVAAVFARSCASAGCHDTAAAAGLDLVGAGWSDRLIGVPSSLCDGFARVVAGEPDASLLIDKLGAAPTCGETMPIGGMLSDVEIECIRTWVAGLPPIDCETCGGATCIDTSADPTHCGACDSPCPGGVVCEAGACACPSGTTACGDACVDTLADGEHCGECDRSCDAGLFCLAGACVDGCGALTECNGGCVNTDTHSLHCGGCDSPCESGGECVGGACDCPGGVVSYTADIEPLMVAGCTSMGCHGFPMPQDGLDLREGAGYASMINVPSDQCGERMLVAPGQPSESYLLSKMTGTDLCMGGQMPKGDPPWSAEQIELLSSWICQGAPE